MHPTPDLGQEAWLRYRPLPTAYAQHIAPQLGLLQVAPELAAASPAITPSLHAEYTHARTALLGVHASTTGTPVQIILDRSLPPQHHRLDRSANSSWRLATSDGPGALYGLFALLQKIATRVPAADWPGSDGPQVSQRILNHWDNVHPKVDIERGYGGETLFKWDRIPGDATCLGHLADYARLLASVGINGLIVNNVNVGENGSQLLREDWLPKVAKVAEIFRAWGISLGLSICYAAPKIMGKLNTSDPREAAVRDWWTRSAERFYSAVPDALGWLVKADSEGQPGPMDYGLDHAQGSQHLAEALSPYGGQLFWRAFVYGHDETDIMAQPYRQFKPLDGKFPANVTLQVKNGPRDFQVREPLHPLLGAMEHTSTALELQITQEYLGHDTHVCFLPSQWASYLANPVEGHDSLADFLCQYPESAVVGVANTHDAPNWTGHLFAQANLYGFARLAWNPQADAEEIARDWAQRTFDGQAEAVATAQQILLNSWPTFEGYTAPFGLGQLYNQADTWDADHFDPAPWRNNGKGWFHADTETVGIDRSAGSNSGLLKQYPSALQAAYNDPKTCPEDLLLFFHQLPWEWPMSDGTPLIQRIYDRYHDSARRVDSWIEAWSAIAGKIDPYRHAHVLERLHRQRYHARLWARYMTSYLCRTSAIPDQSRRSY